MLILINLTTKVQEGTFWEYMNLCSNTCQNKFDLYPSLSRTPPLPALPNKQQHPIFLPLPIILLPPSEQITRQGELPAGPESFDWNIASMSFCTVNVVVRVWQIYSNIQIYLSQIFIDTFVYTDFLKQIYLDICSCHICMYEYIRTFVCERKPMLISY